MGADRLALVLTINQAANALWIAILEAFRHQSLWQVLIADRADIALDCEGADRRGAAI